MLRPILDTKQIHPAIQNKIESNHQNVLKQVIQTVQEKDVVVLGMAGNPFVKKAKKALDAQSIPHTDLDYGSYFSEWRKRNVIKMWSGWPTFPMVFIKGVLVGGAQDLQALIDSGELQRLLNQARIAQ